ncbi:hypothetical protein OPV22_002973 [Ensete ventricosum]|uniref:Ternary complex factor MIP1 leucine-zipper domain-containing protein n=1 Tax=Ensete ventricosum TaxID=4639 RepID=A0AAV8RZH1_ENSVE|nr:hypothetical protein OPV22_002973 [Ensete ventricosum]
MSCLYKGSHNILNILKSHGSQNDIKQLQMHLHQENSTRFLLQKVIGRASSTLSPGQRHFSAQTWELIPEIELHEEEIANCMTSPVHSSHGARKRPSIILSSFCSSKKFWFQPFQVLSSIKDAGRTNILLMLKVRHELLSRENMNLYVRNDFAYPMKEKLPTSGRGHFT